MKNTFNHLPTATQLLDWVEAKCPVCHAPLGELEVDDDLERTFGRCDYTFPNVGCDYRGTS